MTGLAAALKIEHSEAANDVLNVNGLDGNDTISGSVGLAALIKLGIDGGAGNDTINGGDGAETLLGGDGDDAIDGNRGDDTGLLGADNDTFRWDPGDGSDVVEGQDGADDGADTLSSTAPAWPRTSTSPPTASESSSSATPPTSRWT